MGLAVDARIGCIAFGNVFVKPKAALKRYHLSEGCLKFHWPTHDNVVKKPKTAIVIPRSLRRGISTMRYYISFYEEEEPGRG
jgi:hypothetical protein